MNFFEKHGKKIFYIISILILIIMPIISKDYGQTGDEDVEILYGKDIYNYYFHGDKQALDYSNKGPHQEGQQYYGGFFNFITEITHQVFPNFHIVDIRHFFGSIFGSLLMIFTGLFAYRITNKKWLWAILALLFMIFSPRIFGESMNNGKDIPFAFGFILAMFFAVRFIDNYKEKIKIIDCVGIIVGLAIAIGCRSANALILIMYIGIYGLLKVIFDKEFKNFVLNFKEKNTKKFLLYSVGTLIIGYFGGLLFWPFGLEGPISNVLASMEEMKNRATALRMLYDGKMISNQEAPSGYLPNWIMISSPLIIIISYFLFYLTLFINKFSKATNIFLIFASTFPIIYIIYNKSTIYDSWRHLFFVYPFIVTAAVTAISVIASKFNKPNIKLLIFVVAIVGLSPAIIWTFKEHPNQYLYFNEYFGGIKNALGYYEVDYYGHSGKQSANWILSQEKNKEHTAKVKVRSNLEGLDYYFKNDTSWVNYEGDYVRWHERGNKDWDYYISYTRFVPEWQLQKGKWPPKSASYIVKVDDIPVGFVIQRKSKKDFQAFQALEKQNFEEAIRLYEEHLSVDESDEYILLNYAYCLLNSAQLDKLEKAKKALEKALTLNAKLKNAYEMLAYIYHTENNPEKANYYKNKSNSL